MPCRVAPRWRFGFVCLCLAAAVVESLAVYPHSLSFFNLLVGGPRHGHEWLLDSNGAWGQDLLFLKEWLARHPEARPLHLANVGWLDPQALGIDYTLPPVGAAPPVTEDDRLRVASGTRQRAGSTKDRVPVHRSHHAPPANSLSRREKAAVRAGNAESERESIPQTWEDVHSLDDLGPQPGWYAIDVNFLHGTGWSANWPGWRFQKIAASDLNYEYFRHHEPCGHAGYSYSIYQITRDEADRVRRMLGLPPLPGQRR